MQPNTRAVFTEAPGSLSFEMQDIPAIADVAHARDAVVLMDNTWATPLFFPPHERGVDLAIEAGTKYLSGHSDLLLGLVSANDAAGRRLRETFDAFGLLRRPGRRVSGAARPAHHGACGSSSMSSQALAVARWFAAAAGGRARAASGARGDPATRSGSAIFPALSGLFCDRPQADARERGRRLDRRAGRCSASGFHGAASRAW